MEEIKNDNILIKCKACGQEISRNADKCPHCGEPTPKTTAKQKQEEKDKNTWAIVVGIIFLIIGIILMSDGTSKTTSNTSKNRNKNNSYIVLYEWKAE